MRKRLGFIRQADGGFTLIELLVVIAIIALLMSMLMPALTRVKRQARSVACLTKLKQWGIYFSMYAEEYDGKFMQGYSGVAGNRNNRWVLALGAYHKWDSDFTCCPNATKPWQDENGVLTTCPTPTLAQPLPGAFIHRLKPMVRGPSL